MPDWALLETIVKEAEDTLASVQAWSDQEIPTSLKEAGETAVDFALKSAQGVVLVYYDPKQRAEDKQRVIPLPVALALMDEFEERVMLEQIEGGISRLWNFFTSQAQTIVSTVRGLWEIVLAARTEFFWTAVQRFIGGLFRNVLEVAAIADIAIPIKEILATRKVMENKMRKRALPHRNGPRVWRRKRTR